MKSTLCVFVLLSLQLLQSHESFAATLVQPDECELVINDFSDAAAFAASINALGHLIGDDGTMTEFSLVDNAVQFTATDGSFWYTNLRDGDICFDASLYEYLSVTVAGDVGGDMRIVLQQRGSDCDVTPDFTNTASVTIDERTTLTQTLQTIDIPLSEFDLDPSNLNSIVFGDMTGMTRISRVSLKRACAPNLNPRPRTPSPPACTNVLNSFSTDRALTVNDWEGTNSDDLSMKEAPEIVNGGLVLTSASALSSYYFMLAPSCQDVSDHDYLRIRVAAPQNFEMRIDLQQATTCGDASSVISTSVLSTEYVRTFDGSARDIWVPLADFGTVDRTSIMGLFFSGFKDTTIANPDQEVTFVLEHIEFVSSSCMTPETPEPFPITEPCGWIFNDFSDFVTATTLNTLGGFSGDAGTMTTIEATNDFGIRMTSADSSSYWYSHVQGTCTVYDNTLDYLFIRLKAPTGFDMRVDYIKSSDCSDDTQPLITSSVQASTYVTFNDFEMRELYVPLADFGDITSDLTVSAVQIGAFRDVENPLHISEPATIEVFEVSFRPSSCSSVPARPLPPLPCELEIDTFDVSDTSVNLLAQTHGDDGSMDTATISGDVLLLTSSGYESFWFTNLPSCYDVSAYDGVALRVLDLAPDAEFEIRLTFTDSCEEGAPLTEAMRLASTLERETVEGEEGETIWIPFDAVTPSFDKNTQTLVSIIVGGFRNAGETHEEATPVTFGLDTVELRPLVCPTRPPTTTTSAPQTNRPAETTAPPAGSDDDTVDDDDNISPAFKSSLVSTTLFIEAVAILIGFVAVFA